LIDITNRGDEMLKNIILVAMALLISGCSAKVDNGWKIIKDPNSYSVLFRPDGSMVSIIKSQ